MHTLCFGKCPALAVCGLAGQHLGLVLSLEKGKQSWNKMRAHHATQELGHLAGEEALPLFSLLKELQLDLVQWMAGQNAQIIFKMKESPSNLLGQLQTRLQLSLSPLA